MEEQFLQCDRMCNMTKPSFFYFQCQAFQYVCKPFVGVHVWQMLVFV